MNVFLEEERGVGVAEVVEGDSGQPYALQERREGPLTEVGGIDEATTLAREYKALILV